MISDNTIISDMKFNRQKEIADWLDFKSESEYLQWQIFYEFNLNYPDKIDKRINFP